MIASEKEPYQDSLASLGTPMAYGFDSTPVTFPPARILPNRFAILVKGSFPEKNVQQGLDFGLP